MFERVGRGVAHDEYIEFEVKSGKILFEGDETEITRGKMRVEFIKVKKLVCYFLMLGNFAKSPLFQKYEKHYFLII